MSRYAKHSLPIVADERDARITYLESAIAAIGSTVKKWNVVSNNYDNVPAVAEESLSKIAEIVEESLCQKN